MTRPPENFSTRFFAMLAVGVLLFAAAATEALVAHAARGSAPVAVALRNGALQHSATAAGVGCDARVTIHHPATHFPANPGHEVRHVPDRVGGR